jgi:hypothetical protein
LQSLSEVLEVHRCRNPHFGPSVRMKFTLPKVGDLESSGTPESLEFDGKGENTSPWGVLGVIGKLLKCKCPKWPHIGHLDICSPSYGQKKGRESNCQFDALPSPGVNPLEGSPMWSCGIETQKGAPDFQHYKGVEGRAKSLGICEPY